MKFDLGLSLVDVLEVEVGVGVVTLCLHCPRPARAGHTAAPPPLLAWECPNSSATPPIPPTFNLQFLRTHSPHLSCQSSKHLCHLQSKLYMLLTLHNQIILVAKERTKKGFQCQRKRRETGFLAPGFLVGCRIRPQSAKLYTGVSLAGRGFTPVCHSLCRNREFSHRSRALLIILLLCPLTLPFTPLTLCEKLHQPASYFSLVAILVGSQTQYSSHYHQTPSQDLLVKNFDTFLPRQQQFTTPGPFLLRALPKDLPPRGSPQKPREEPPAGMSRLQQVLRRPEWSDQAPGGGGSRFILKEIRF